MAATAPEQAALSFPRGLRDLLRAGASQAEIERHVEALSPEEQLNQVLAVKGKWVKVLYDSVAGAKPVDLEELVPTQTAGKTLVYEGRNSLFMFTRFQKRFLRTKSGVIVGYNHQTMMWITGPGYFVFQAESGKPPVPDQAYIDYITEPPEFPEGWPAYKPNGRGLSKLVYYNMHDYMRRVAKGVYVGKAYKAGEEVGAYFSLTLQPAARSEMPQ